MPRGPPQPHRQFLRETSLPGLLHSRLLATACCRGNQLILPALLDRAGDFIRGVVCHTAEDLRWRDRASRRFPFGHLGQWREGLARMLDELQQYAPQLGSVSEAVTL